MSHTREVKIEFRDKGALGAAVQAMGGTVLGEGTYYFGGTANTGFGFKLTGWQHPCVFTAAGILKFDDYNGAWGNRADLDKLKGEYAVEMAKAKCEALGWMCQREANGALTIFHPTGGSIVVTVDGTVDALGFQGPSCQEAVETIAAALGEETGRYCKPEAQLVKLPNQVVA